MSLCAATSIPVPFAFRISSTSVGTSCTVIGAAPVISLVMVLKLILEPLTFIKISNCTSTLVTGQMYVRMSQVFVSTGFKYAYSTCTQLILTLVLVVELVKVGLRRKIVIGETAGLSSTTSSSGERVSSWIRPAYSE